MATPAPTKTDSILRPFAKTGDISVAEIRSHESGIARFVGMIERVMDLLAVAMAAALSYGAYAITGLGRHLHYPLSEVVISGVSFAALFVLLLEKNGEYKSASLLNVRETERVLRTTWQALALVFPIAFFSGHAYSRLVLLFAAFITPLFLLLEHQLTTGVVQYLCQRCNTTRPALIYGSGSTARKVYSALLRSPKLAMYPVAFVDDGSGHAGREVFEASYRRKHSAKVLPGPLTAKMLRDLEIGTLILTSSPKDSSDLDAILKAANEVGVSTLFSPALMRREDPPLEYMEIDGFMFARATRNVPSPLYEALKRGFDLVVSSVLILLTAPVLSGIALLIRFGSSGPIIFVQQRIGRHGRAFSMYKFRTMYVDAPKYAFSPKHVGDPRITPIGRLLRRSSLDEIPQLFNVLLGHMSLVGPRPEMDFIVQRYTPAQRRRLDVSPGLTGLWQLSADRAFLIHENIEYDLYYAQNRSFFLDLAILFHTALFAARGV
ncbi:MAG TPA: sugar transferase [Candidatus Koribacter sp.]|jgi:exopolysaccharide biosynthesis polyprenyl glycosylphosphotransferase